MASAVRAAAATLSNAARRRPVAAASFALSAKYGLADLGTQYATAGSDGIRPERLALFGLFGAYYGTVNFYVFAAINAVPWPSRLVGAAGMAIFDAFVHVPLSIFPQFYMAQSAAYSLPTSVEGLLECKRAGLATWRVNFLEDVRTSAMIFMPIDLVMFYFVPLHLRTPFLSCVGWVFPVALSKLRGAEGKERFPLYYGDT